MIKQQTLLSMVCASALAVLASPAFAVTIDYAATAGSQINLDSTDGCGGGVVGCFNFTPNSPGINLEITSGSATGFTGSVNGLFGVGQISTLAGGLETAVVNGTGNLAISDGANTLDAVLTWKDITTVGVAGVLNVSGNVNLTQITYSGLDVDLLALANAGSGTQTATFQFTSAQSLTDLFESTASGVTSTSFSGSISAIPVPAAVWLFGSGLLGLAGIARRKALVA